MDSVTTRPGVLFGTLFGIALSAYLGYIVTGSEGNAVSILTVIGTLVTFVVGLVRPLVGLRLIIVMAATLDLLKRFLIIYENVTIFDVGMVLAAAPITMLGVFIGCIFRPYLRGSALSLVQWRLIVISFAVIALAFVLHVNAVGSVGKAFVDTANDGSYVLMVPIIYILFHEEGIAAIKRLLRFILLIFTPVAIYGCWQYWFGLTSFEIAYLRSGLTVTEGYLVEINPRPFSSLNSITAFSTMVWFGFVLSVYFGYLTQARRRFVYRLLPLIFGVAMIFSLARSAIVFCMVTVPGVLIFRSRTGTIAVYATLLGLFVAMVLNAGFLLDQLAPLEEKLPTTSPMAQQMFRLGTFSDRLFGYQNVLAKPSTWTLFGREGEDLEGGGSSSKDFSHDALSQLILSRGVIFTLSILGSIAFCLRWAHRKVYRQLDSERRLLAAMLLALPVFFTLSNAGGYGFHIFPINLFVWLFVGCFCVLGLRDEEAEEAEIEAGMQTVPEYTENFGLQPLSSPALRAIPAATLPTLRAASER